MKTAFVLAVVIGTALGQYGPPKQTGPKKHRTTTTEPPNLANEVSPSVYQESGVLPDGGNYEIKTSSLNQPGLSVMSHSYSFSGPNSPQNPPFSLPSQPSQPVDISKNPFINAGLNGVPVPSSQGFPNQPGKPGYPSTGSPNQPNQQGQQSLPFPNPQQPSQPGYPNQQGQQSLPFPNPQQPSKPGYPNQQGQQPFPNPQQPSQPGFPNQQPFPNPQQPSKPGYPNQPNQQGQQPLPFPNPQQPSQPGFPNQQGQQPFPNPQQPSKPGYPNQPNQQGQQSLPFPNPQQPSQPGYPNQQGQQPFPNPQQPGFPNQQGQQPFPKPQQPSKPGYPNQPNQQGQQPLPFPNPQQPSQPGFPNQQGQQPFPNPQQPSRPGYPNQQPNQQGQQPFPSGPQAGKPDYPSGSPNQPNQQGQQSLPFPNPQQPSRPGYPNQQQQPQQPQFGKPQPQPGTQPSGNPFLSGKVPVGNPVCNGDHQYCVPQNACYNGLLTDGSTQPELKYKKGQCNAGEVCCKSPNKPPSYGQPSPNYATTPQPKYTGPLNTTPPPGCAAALKCVEEIYCTVDGVMSDTPVALTRDQTENKVPLTDCQNLDTGIIGKCCRDPNYKDPWPAGMMMPMPNTGFDDGQYRPGQYPGESPGEAPANVPQVNPYLSKPVTIAPQNPHTIKKPLGVFNMVVTPFPVAPKPGQTHAQVFPKNEDKAAGAGNPFLQNIPRPGQTTGPYNQPGGHPIPIPNRPPGQTPPYNPQNNTPFPGGQTTQQGYNPQQQPQYPSQPQYTTQPKPQTQPIPQPQPSPQPQYPTPQQPQFPPQPQPSPQQPQYTTQPKPQTQPIPQQPQPQPQPQYPSQPQQPQTQQPQYPSQPQQPQTQQPQFPSQPQPQQPQPQQPQYPSQPPQFTPHHTTPNVESNIVPGQECGVRRPVPPTKPDETGFGEFPWHVAILSAGNRSAICSGAIIAPNAVLTAAHCVEGIKPEDMVIKAGDWSLGQPGDKPIQMRVVAATAIHPVYSSGSLIKDQAVIVVEKPFNFEQNVDKICLPAPGADTYTPSTTTCYLTGWGRPALQNNEPGSVLHKVPISIIPKDQCENQLKKTHLGKYFILNEGFTCAVPPSEADLCKVDIGSPLVCQRPDGHYELAGVYSWDTKCSSSLPGIMATCDTDWVNKILATPVDELKQQSVQKQATHTPEDIDSKPGFALGYGK